MRRNLVQGSIRQGQPGQILVFLPHLAQVGNFDHSAYPPYFPAHPEDPELSLVLVVVSKESA